MTFPSGRTSDGLWLAADSTERDAIGSADALRVDDLSRIGLSTFRCLTVAGLNASTWALHGGGGGGGSVIPQFDAPDSVLDRDLTAPPGGESAGDRYLVAAAATGAWAGESDSLAEYDGSEWIFTTPTEGMRVVVEDENAFVYYDGSTWVDGLSAHRLLLAGAEPADASALSSDLVIGDPAIAGDYGATVVTAGGAGDEASYILTHIAGQRRAGMRITGSDDVLRFRAGGADAVLIAGTGVPALYPGAADDLGLVGTPWVNGHITTGYFAGAASGDANAVADDLVIGDGSATDRGLTVFVGSASNAYFAATDAGGAIRGGVRWGASTEKTFLYSNGAIQVTVDGINAEFTSNTDAAVGLGGTTTSGWSSLVLTERADHVGTPTATRAEMWLDDDTYQALRLTTDDGNDHQINWRERRFQTVSSAANNDTTIATLSADGDAATVEVLIVGVDAGGDDVISRRTIATYYRTGGTVTAASAHLDDQQSDGVPTTATSVVISGNNVVARVNGDAADTHDWAVAWHVRYVGT